eukprot:NODE_141_length_15967_cov_0.946118.p5 type:complete len:357 gc:universal NODE_141_length_15967_cov_0.946118:10285-11355(+)
MLQKEITICLSGGIDSAIAGYLLKKRGYKLKAIYMKNWDTPITPDPTPKVNRNFDLSCPFHKDYLYAQNIAEFLEIDLKLINLEKEYWNLVFEPFLEELKDGNTPNPDITCNQSIKFGALRDHLDTKLLATGHYARLINGHLTRARDRFKDQSYFLCEVENFDNCVFPLGDILKLQVKWLAYKISKSGRPNSKIFEDLLQKKESMGICFIGKRKFGDFVGEYIEHTKGKVIDIRNHRVISDHQGLHLFTIGQKIRISGQPESLFVIRKNETDIYVGPHDHPELFTDTINASKIKWVFKPDNCKALKYKCRHPSSLKDCTYDSKYNLIRFSIPVRAMTPGQTLCFYDNDLVVGSFKL